MDLSLNFQEIGSEYQILVRCDIQDYDSNPMAYFNFIQLLSYLEEPVSVKGSDSGSDLGLSEISTTVAVLIGITIIGFATFSLGLIQIILLLTLKFASKL